MSKLPSPRPAAASPRPSWFHRALLLAAAGVGVVAPAVSAAPSPWQEDNDPWSSFWEESFWNPDRAILKATPVAVRPQLNGVILNASPVTQNWLGDGGANGTSGNWNTANDWSPSGWGSGNIAVFGSAGGMVTVGTQTASGLTFNVGGYTLQSGTLTLNTGSVITTTGGTTTFASSLSLSGAAGVALTKNGSGILALSTSNTGLGTAASPASWTVNGGTLNNGVFDSILSIGVGNNLGVAPTSGTTATQVILDAGTLLFTGTGLAPAIGNGRTIQINAGGGAIVDSTGNPFYGNITTYPGATTSPTLYLSNTSGTTTFSKDPSTSVTTGGVISGALGLVWNGAGTLALGGANTYSGGTTINSGTVSFTADNNLGADSGAVTLAGGTLSLASGSLSGSTTGVFAHNIATGTTGGTINVASGAVLGLNYFNQNSTGDLTGSGPLTKTGAGQLILSGNNSNYSGNWTFNGGLVEVQYNGSTSLGSGTITLASGTEMAVNYGKTITNNITSAGATLSYAVGGGGTYAGTLALTTGTTTTVGLRDFYNANNAENGSITGVISGGGALSLSGGGTLILNPGGNNGTTGNTFTGGVTLGTGSTLGIYSGNALGSAPSTAATQLTFAGNSTLQFEISPTAAVYSTRNFLINSGVTATIDTQAYNASIAGVIQGSGSLAKIGGGTLTLTGTNTYTGGTTVTAGAIAISADANLGDAGGALTLNGGTLASVQTSGITMTRTINVGANGGTIQLNGKTPTSGNNKITLGTTGQLTGSGALTLTNNGLLSISAANANYSGAWTLNGGVLELTNAQAAGTGSITVNTGAELSTLGSQISNALVLNGGTIGWDYYSGTGNYQGPVTLGSGGGTVSLVNFYSAPSATNLASNIYNVNGNNISGTISGVISGPGALTTSDVNPYGTINGGGTLTLTGTNTYTGGTTVGVGTTVVMGNAAALGATTNALTLSGTLSLNGYNLTTGALTINGASQGPVATASVGTVGAGTFGFTFNGGSVEKVTVASATINGTADVLINPANLTTPGTYTLVTSNSGTLSSAWEFAGAENMSVPVNSIIVKSNTGSQYDPSSYYRLTLVNNGGSEQVVVSNNLPSRIVTILPIGSSTTAGQSNQNPYNGGGYRTQLYQDLVNDGRFIPNYVGSTTASLSNAPNESYLLASANQQANEGHPGWTSLQILANLNMTNGDPGANGGYWLMPGNGENPNYITINIGGNDAVDYGTSAAVMGAASQRMDAILSQFNNLRPGVSTIVSSIVFRSDGGGNYSVNGLDPYYNPAMQGIVFNHVLAGQNVSFLDLRNVLSNPSDISSDGIHPTQAGYDKDGNAWYQALVYGQAYWTGNQSNVWNTVNGTSTNFAQDSARTTDRGQALNSATANQYLVYPDVYFNNNTTALNTTLGADTTIRSLNFTSGATGSVTVGGSNTLTIGTVDASTTTYTTSSGATATENYTAQNSGGITVQAGSGAHTIAANITLGADQSWGNVSSNDLTVSGAIGGAHSLAFVGSYTVYQPGTYTAGTNYQNGTFTTTAQTVRGTGGFRLSGASGYTGATAISNVTVTLDNAGSTSARLAGTSGITLNPGGTLLLASSSGTSTDRINNNATLTMAGGTLNTSGLSEGTVSTGGVPTQGIGALTLTANSVLDLGAGASIVTFANSSAAAWTAGTQLQVQDWTNGADHVYFGSDSTGLTGSQLGQVAFYSDAGSTFLGYAGFGANGEIVPVPEPATVFGGLLLVGAAGYRVRRQSVRRRPEA